MDGLVKDRDFGDGQLTDEWYVWACAIGGVNPVVIPPGGDGPMRDAVEAAFHQLTGQKAEACFSGWGCEFTERAKAVIQDRLPADDAAGDEALAAKLAEREEQVTRLLERQDDQDQKLKDTEARAEAAEAENAKLREVLTVALPHLDENARYLRDIQANAGKVHRAFDAASKARAALQEKPHE